MDTSQHTLHTLFDQLGLPSDEGAIDGFLEHHTLAPETRLDQADFWSAGQAQFIREALEEDSDWSEIVDQLDTLLRG